MAVLTIKGEQRATGTNLTSGLQGISNPSTPVAPRMGFRATLAMQEIILSFFLRDEFCPSQLSKDETMKNLKTKLFYGPGGWDQTSF